MKFKSKAVRIKHHIAGAIPEQAWVRIGLFNQELPDWIIDWVKQAKAPGAKYWPQVPVGKIRECKLLWLTLAYLGKPIENKYLTLISSRFNFSIETNIELAIIFGNIDYFQKLFDEYSDQLPTKRYLQALQKLFTLAAFHSKPAILELISYKLMPYQLELIMTKNNSIIFCQAAERGDKIIVEYFFSQTSEVQKKIISDQNFQVFTKAIQAGQLEIVHRLFQVSNRLGLEVPDNINYSAFEKAWETNQQIILFLACGKIFSYAASLLKCKEFITNFVNNEIDALIDEEKKYKPPFDIDVPSSRLAFQYLEYLIKTNQESQLARISFLTKLPSIQTLIEKSKDETKHNSLFLLAAKTGNIKAALILIDDPESYQTEEQKIAFILELKEELAKPKDKIETTDFKEQKFVHTNLSSIPEANEFSDLAIKNTKKPPAIQNLIANTVFKERKSRGSKRSAETINPECTSKCQSIF